MDKQNRKSVSDWDKLEKEKRADVKRLGESMDMLKAKRADMLLLIGEGRIEKKGLEAIEKEIKDCGIELEAAQSLLTAIPRRRDFARADELEEAINEIEELSRKMAELRPSIDTAAETFVLALLPLYEAQEALKKKLPHTISYQSHEHSVLDSLGIALRAHGLWKYIKIGNYLHPEPMANKESVAERAAGGIIITMREHAKQLRGEGGRMNPDLCKECYGKLVLINPSDSKMRCRECGKEAEE